jgi:hypothetical protein
MHHQITFRGEEYFLQCDGYITIKKLQKLFDFLKVSINVSEFKDESTNKGLPPLGKLEKLTKDNETITIKEISILIF